MRHNDEKGMTEDELVANIRILLIGGSETSATVLSGLLFHLLKTPRVLQKLQEEIRSTFKSPSEMAFSTEAKLPYMQACIEEALRIYPPVASTMPRYTPPAGVIVDGQFIPGNVTNSLNYPSSATTASANWLPDNSLRSPPQRLAISSKLQGSSGLCPRALARR